MFNKEDFKKFKETKEAEKRDKRGDENYIPSVGSILFSVIGTILGISAVAYGVYILITL